MKNLKLLHCSTARVPDPSGRGRRFLAVDSLSPTLYFLCGNTLYGLDHERKVKLNRNLASDVLAADGSDVVVGMEFLPDLQQLCFCTSTGNIAMLDVLTNQVDVSGCVPCCVATSCWSPDHEILVVVSMSDIVYLLNRDFEVTNEFPLHPAEFGTDDLITVGWGKKETQFHGSEGKQAALVKPSADTGTALDWDDEKVRVSWRGDGLYFCISALDPERGRTIRVWSREGSHCSTNERVDGLGQCLAWKPSGSLIACSKNAADVCQMIFYERNGLRHGEYTLPFDSGCQVQECLWNRDSTIFAVWLRSIIDQKIYLQLYTSSNHHWYCKLSYEFSFENGPVAWCWDPDHSNTLHVAFKHGLVRSYVFASVVSRLSSSNKEAALAVIDGRNVLMTDFGKAVVPPPMCQQTILLPAFVNEVTCWGDGDPSLACLTVQGDVALLAAADDKGGLKNGSIIPAVAPVLVRLRENPDDVVYHLNYLRSGCFAYVVLSNDGWSLVVSQLTSDKLEQIKRIPLEKDVFQLVPLLGDANRLAVLESADGSFSVLTRSYEVVPCAIFTKPLASAAVHVEAIVADQLYVVCLNERFQLTINGTEISNEANSFCLTEAFILYTTITHQLICLALENIQSVMTSRTLNAGDPRNVERGSKIVAAVGEEGKVVLQMPRGNLEAIYPRALVLSIAKKMLKSLNYKDALMLMRRHRVNLNLLFDFSPKTFLDHVDEFISKINDPVLLNLFISDLKNEDVTESMYSQYFPRPVASSSFASSRVQNVKDKVNFVCGHLRDALQIIQPSHKFCTSILMTLVKMTPPHLDSALQVVKDFRDSGVDTKTIDEALQHLLYVIDANRLFDVALGTYDFELVLMVAEKSHKDPKEFLPFLSELQSLESSYRKYRIDVHLSRFDKALPHLFRAVGDEGRSFDEFMDFIKKHDLYVQALRLVSPDSPQQKAISGALADNLMINRRFDQAAISYQIAGDVANAIDAYSKALNWKMALALAVGDGWQGNKIATLCEDLSRRLKDHRLFKDAASLEYEYLKDINRCVLTLTEGGLWEEAIFRIHQSGESQLVESILLPALTNNSQKVTEIIEKQLLTFVEYKDRLSIVREQKRSRLSKLNETGELDDLAGDASTEVSSTITKSSAARSSMSASSRARRAKKHERKKYSLKEGNPYEDLGLLKELSEIVEQANKMQGDVASLLRVLAQFQLQTDGQRLQRAFGHFLDKISSSIVEIWPDSIDLYMLPGPIEDQLVGENLTAGDMVNRFCGVIDARLKIKLDGYLMQPKTSFDSSWALLQFS